MKNVKKLLSIILSITMLLTLTVGLNLTAYAAESSGSCGDNATYKFDSTTGELTISGTGAITVGAFSTHQGLSNAIKLPGDIKSVVINNGITSIGGYAFWECSKITSIKIPNSVTSIGGRAFRDCSSLKSITLPPNLTNIDFSTFMWCSSLTSITIPDGVTSIDAQAFFDCSSLESIIIPKSVTDISWDAFNGCKSLQNVYYKGSSETWKAINIDRGNDYLTNATVHYNYKLANPLEAKGKKLTVKYSKLKKSNQTIAQKKAFSVKSAKGKVTYKKLSGNKKIVVSSTGKIKIKKGLKTGTYKIKVKVTAAGDTIYKSGNKTVTVTIIIK